MATVWFRLPRLLTPFAGGARRFSVTADTLDHALAAAIARYPMLAHHLWDEDGAQRRHVHIALHGHDIRWLRRLDIPVSDGDEIVVIQAVSGG